MNLATSFKQPEIDTRAGRHYLIWKKRGVSPVHASTEGPGSGDMEFLGRVIHLTSLNQPLLYVTPEGRVFRTTRVKMVAQMDDTHLLIRTRNSEYILRASPA